MGTGEGLEISIPARRHVLHLMFLSLWLVGWCLGEVFAARELLIGENGPADVIAFDYGSTTVRCASDVEEAEAGEIVRDLKAEHAFPEVGA